MKRNKNLTHKQNISMKNWKYLLSLIPIVSIIGCHSTQNVRIDSNFVYSKAKYGEDKFVKVEGYKIHYVEAGKGEPVILIPGSFSTYRSWNRIMPLMSNQYRLLALDYVGMGDSDKPKSGFKYTIEEQADLTAKMIKKLKLGKVNLIGVSYGGVIVLNIAARYPELVNKVVSIEGSVLKPRKMGGYVIMQYIYMWPIGCCTIGITRAGLLDKLLLKAVADKWYPYMTSDDKEELLDIISYETKSATRVSWYWQSVAYKKIKHFAKEAKTIRAPVLWLYGKESYFIDMVKENIEFFKVHLPNVQIVGFEDGIHDLEIQKPKEVADSVLNFFHKE